MKKFIFLIVTFLVFKSDVFSLTCKYNVSGYVDDDIYWEVDSTKDKPANAKINMIGGLATNPGSEPVLNWDSAKQGYKAEDDINNGQCPAYLIQTYAQGWFHGYEVFLSDSNHLLSIVNSEQKYLLWNADLSVFVFKLANRTKDNNVAVTCSYTYPGDDSFNFNLLYDKDGNLIGTDETNKWYQAKTILSYTAYEEKLNSNSCNVNAYRCYDGEVGYNRVYLNSSGFLYEDRTFSSDYGFCSRYNFNPDNSNSSSGKPIEVDSACKWYSSFKEKLVAAATKFKNCDKKDESCGLAMGEYNRAETEISTFCKSIYNMTDFSDSCVQQCVKLETEISEIKKQYNISGGTSNNENCGLSARLANWILKIIKWMRYIVPILLIILSILDYIKAIASDSEDEVKKVTSKFVKRLIVSVIIFLLPLALEFLLKIFGIPVNDFCL